MRTIDHDSPLTVSVHDVAQYFVNRAGPQVDSNGEPDETPGIATMKLTKLVYLAQGYHLLLCGAPLFTADIVARRTGPVVPLLLRRYPDPEPGEHPAHVTEWEPGDETRIAPESRGVLDFLIEAYSHHDDQAIMRDTRRHRVNVRHLDDASTASPGRRVLPWPEILSQFELIDDFSVAALALEEAVRVADAAKRLAYADTTLR